MTRTQKAWLLLLFALALAGLGTSALAQGVKNEAPAVIPVVAHGKHPSITTANGATQRIGITTGMGHGGSRPRGGAVNAAGGQAGSSGVVHAGQGRP